MSRPTLGLDVGGSSVKWALLAADDEILDAGALPTPESGRDAVVELLADIGNGPGAGAGSVAIAIPGHADRRTGAVTLVPNIPGSWPGFPLGPAVVDRVNRPVTVLNDARAHARAELRLGAARGRRNVLFAVVGTGIGGAVALAGRVLTNSDDGVGEVGHVVVEPDGAPCGCGALGCLETVASAPALVAAATRAVLLGLSPALAATTGRRLDRLTPAVVAGAARDGDPYCRDLLARAGRAMGLAFGSVCAVLALDTVVVGGGAEGAIDLLLPHLREHLGARTSIFAAVSVRRAELGPTAGAVGAALVARQHHTTHREERDLALDH